MKQLFAATTALAFAVTTPAAAQQAMEPAPAEAPAVQTGTMVYGSDGVEVGTVAGEQGDAVILQVGERMIPFPTNAIGNGAKGPMIALTRTALVAEYDQRLAEYEAKLDAAVVAGATVQTSDNQTLGTIATVDGDAVAVEGSDGPMNLTKRSLALNPDGEVIIQATMAQIRQAMGGAAQ